MKSSSPAAAPFRWLRQRRRPPTSSSPAAACAVTPDPRRAVPRRAALAARPQGARASARGGAGGGQRPRGRRPRPPLQRPRPRPASPRRSAAQRAARAWGWSAAPRPTPRWLWASRRRRERARPPAGCARLRTALAAAWELEGPTPAWSRWVGVPKNQGLSAAQHRPRALSVRIGARLAVRGLAERARARAASSSSSRLLSTPEGEGACKLEDRSAAPCWPACRRAPSTSTEVGGASGAARRAPSPARGRRR